MNKNSKLSLIFTDRNVTDYAYKVAKGNDLYKDIISEIIISLYDLPEDKFEKITDLKSYVCKMIYFSWNSQTSPFYKKFRNDRDFVVKEDLSFDEEIEENKYIDLFEFKRKLTEIESNISKKRFPSEIKLCELYLEHKSYRAVANLLDIPVTSVHFQVNKVIEEMKNEDTFNNKS